MYGCCTALCECADEACPQEISERRPHPHGARRERSRSSGGPHAQDTSRFCHPSWPAKACMREFESSKADPHRHTPGFFVGMWGLHRMRVSQRRDRRMSRRLDADESGSGGPDQRRLDLSGCAPGRPSVQLGLRSPDITGARRPGRVWRTRNERVLSGVCHPTLGPHVHDRPLRTGLLSGCEAFRCLVPSASPARRATRLDDLQDPWLRNCHVLGLTLVLGGVEPGARGVVLHDVRNGSAVVQIILPMYKVSVQLLLRSQRKPAGLL